MVSHAIHAPKMIQDSAYLLGHGGGGRRRSSIWHGGRFEVVFVRYLLMMLLRRGGRDGRRRRRPHLGHLRRRVSAFKHRINGTLEAGDLDQNGRDGCCDARKLHEMSSVQKYRQQFPSTDFATVVSKDDETLKWENPQSFTHLCTVGDD